MRVLFDIVHPANVLFFVGAMERMKARGDEILILSRHKDIACDLLDQFGLAHTPVSTAGNGLAGLLKELIWRDVAILKQARRFKPNIMLGFGGVAISHVGKILNIPAVSFYDTETATLQNAITRPFISHLYVPEGYDGPVPKGRTTYFKGTKAMSYFHPENFVVDPIKAEANGWDPSQDNYFVRTVEWRANHDIGKQGWSDGLLTALVKKLAARGKVHISSERQLPAALAQYGYKGAKNELHHVMAKCHLYVGESATMAAEAYLLGVPSIYDGKDHPGIVEKLAQENLIIGLRQEGQDALFAAVDKLLAEGLGPAQARRDNYCAKRPNLISYIVAAADQHAKQAQT